MKEMNNRMYSIRRIVVIFSIVVLFAICVIVSWAAAYTIYNTDDFSIAVTWMNYKAPATSFFQKSIQLSMDDWMHWGGHYFSTFLYNIFDPLIGNGLMQLRIIMVFNAFLLCGSIIFFIYVSLRIKEFDGSSCIMAAVCVLWVFFDYKSWTEVVFWFSGAVDYSIELSLFLLSYVLFVLGLKKNKGILNIISLVVLFFAAGGNQSIAMVCFVCYFLMLLEVLFIKKERNHKVIYILVAIGIPLLNLLAPGNFARHELLGDTHFLRSVFYALRIFVVETERLFKDSIIFVLLLMIFVWRYFNGDHEKRIRLFDVLTFWGISTGVAFLACLGYNSPYLPNRILFVVDFFLIVGYFGCALMLGDRLSRQSMQDEKHQLSLQYMGLLIVAVLVLMPYRIETGNIYKMGKGLVTGEIQSYYESVSDIYTKIEQSPDDKVTIESLPKPVEGFVELWLSTDENDYWYIGNSGIGAYYGKKIFLLNDYRGDE